VSLRQGTVRGFKKMLLSGEKKRKKGGRGDLCANKNDMVRGRLCQEGEEGWPIRAGTERAWGSGSSRRAVEEVKKKFQDGRPLPCLDSSGANLKTPKELENEKGSDIKKGRKPGHNFEQGRAHPVRLHQASRKNNNNLG